MGRLRKRDVERLLSDLQAAGDNAEGLRTVLTPFLAIVLDRPGEHRWLALVDAAGNRNAVDGLQWPLLQSTDTTDDVTLALWDLATFLNEHRTLDV